tara:strand:+ start:6190 stop:6459 length:270 start_codon:yes stop_codon:yes gene_type:complete
MIRDNISFSMFHHRVPYSKLCASDQEIIDRIVSCCFDALRNPSKKLIMSSKMVHENDKWYEYMDDFGEDVDYDVHKDFLVSLIEVMEIE